MAPFPPRPPSTPSRRPPAAAAFLGWLVPGLGQLFLGRPLKALLFFAAILPTFVVGWALTDGMAVDPQQFRLDFAGQVFLGLPTLGALLASTDRVLATMPPWFEVGRLYVLVAGLLNVVAMCDAIGDAIARDRELLASRRASAGWSPRPAEAVEEPPPAERTGWEDPA